MAMLHDLPDAYRELEWDAQEASRDEPRMTEDDEDAIRAELDAEMDAMYEAVYWDDLRYDAELDARDDDLPF